MVNKSGPKIEPWGTPNNISAQQLNQYNSQIDNAKDIDVVIPIYNLIKFGNNYSKTLGSL